MGYATSLASYRSPSPSPTRLHRLPHPHCKPVSAPSAPGTELCMPVCTYHTVEGPLLLYCRPTTKLREGRLRSSGVSSWPKVTHLGSEMRCDDQRQRDGGRCYAAGFEDGGRGHSMRTVGASRRGKRRGNQFSPKCSRSNQPWPHLDFSPVKPTMNHDYKKINL